MTVSSHTITFWGDPFQSYMPTSCSAEGRSWHVRMTPSQQYSRPYQVSAQGFVLIVPTAGWAADRFKDVPDSNVFHDDISWLAATGVTKGCNPPENDQFCPTQNVTRGQMAAFPRRALS